MSFTQISLTPAEKAKQRLLNGQPSKGQLRRANKKMKLIKQEALTNEIFELVELRKKICSFLPFKYQLRLWCCKKSWHQLMQLLIQQTDFSIYSSYQRILFCGLKNYSCNTKSQIINLYTGEIGDFTKLLLQLDGDFKEIRDTLYDSKKPKL